MTDEQLAEIKARCEAATPGPWTNRRDRRVIRTTRYVSDVIAHVEQQPYNDYVHFQNGDFIAHARTDIPALVAEVERLREALRGERAEG